MAESFASSSTWTGHVRPPTAGRPAVAIRTLGCKVNQVESEDIAAGLVGRGFRISELEDADVVVVNTCTVTAESDRKARKLVRHVHALSSNPIVVVTGCMATLAGELLDSLGERVIVESDKSMVASRVAGLLSLPDEAGDPSLRAGLEFRTRALVKVEDGCDAHCTYCIVPQARGNPRSVPLEDVVRQVEAFVAEGAGEIVLTGINIGRYANGPARLPELLRAVGGTGIARIRLSSIEPEHLTESLLAAITETPAFCEHLHVPMQSGSNDVLRRMSRSYTVEEYEAHISAAREALPGVCVSTDVIAGFPGESDEHAEETLAACKRIGFGKMHVFRYSRRAGTVAAGLPEQLAPDIVGDRARALREIGASLVSDWIDSRIGMETELLVETEERAAGVEGVRLIAGMTRDYIKAEAVSGPGHKVGQTVRLQLVGRRGAVALGRLSTDGSACSAC